MAASSFSRYRMRPGWVEVIAGCMYSGKTEELIRQIRRAELAKQPTQVFKPKIDNRYADDAVASHNRNQFPSQVVTHALEILTLVEKSTQVVGIDEGQFFGNDLLEVTEELADAGKRVIVAGLDTDWKARPFGPIPFLMATAEVVRKQYAVCMVCGDPATRTQRLIASEQDILVGSIEAYEARCRVHFDPHLSLRLQQAKTAEPVAFS